MTLKKNCRCSHDTRKGIFQDHLKGKEIKKRIIDFYNFQVYRQKQDFVHDWSNCIVFSKDVSLVFSRTAGHCCSKPGTGGQELGCAQRLYPQTVCLEASWDCSPVQVEAVTNQLVGFVSLLSFTFFRPDQMDKGQQVVALKEKIFPTTNLPLFIGKQKQFLGRRKKKSKRTQST